MTFKWDSEVEAKRRTVQSNDKFKTTEDFIALRESLWPSELNRLEEMGRTLNVTSTLDSLRNHLQHFVYAPSDAAPENTEAMLLAVVCAEAIAIEPTAETWNSVQKIASHSWEVEHWLAYALLAKTRESVGARDSIFALAANLFRELDEFSNHSWATERHQPWAMKEFWQSQEYKLDDIWFGLRSGGGLEYLRASAIFVLLNDLAHERFIDLLGDAKNPYLVESALIMSGAGTMGSRFESWQRIMHGARNAFLPNGQWNGSLLAPLLLVTARSEVHETVRVALRARDSPSDEALKTRISDACTSIVSTIAARSDALPMLARWSTWIVRNILGASNERLSTARSSEYCDNVLLDVIGKELGKSHPYDQAPKDAASWESWCYLCALSLASYNGHLNAPSIKEFSSQWKISADDWSGEKGRQLRASANVIVTLTKDAPGLASHLLAFSLRQEVEAEALWQQLWVASHPLREIVEYGDADAQTNDYASRGEANGLLLLLFRIGLAIFDQGVDRLEKASIFCGRRRLVDHFACLSVAANEMLEIDNTLYQKDWWSMKLHLVTRRILWERDDAMDEDGKIFHAEDLPTSTEFLVEARRNPVELVQILMSVLSNSFDDTRMHSLLGGAAIDISEVARTLRRLNGIDARRYPVDDSWLQRILKLSSPSPHENDARGRR